MANKIVLIDPNKGTIEKTYETFTDVLIDLKLTLAKNNRDALAACLNNQSYTFSEHIIKYETDASAENIKLWCAKFNKRYRKIVLIDPKTKTITKTYNNTKEVATDLKIKGRVDQSLKGDRVKTINGYILRYESDATTENIKKWCDSFNAKHQQIVLIDPDKYSIQKTYESIEEATNDLHIDKKISHCLIGNQVAIDGYILKYEKDATVENIKIWCDFYNESRRYMKNKNIVTIDPIKQIINRTYKSINEAYIDIKSENKAAMIGCLNGYAITHNGYIIKYEDDATPENIKKWSDVTTSSPNGFRKCRACNLWVKEEDYVGIYCSKDDFLTSMSSNIKQRGIEHYKNGKTSIAYELSYDDLIKIYNDQKGMCHYSGIKMETTHYTNWQCSPERLDNSKGYTVDNVRLICLEFNVYRTNWKENIGKIESLRSKIVDISKLKKEVIKAKKNINASKGVRKGEFYVFIRKLFGNACAGSRYKSKIGAKKELLSSRSQLTITKENLFDKIIEQKGRCYYSGIPLVFKSNSEWKCSLERLDNKKGYTNENTVLICVEFNSSDLTNLTSNQVTGSCQWSKDKFEYLLEHLNKEKV